MEKTTTLNVRVNPEVKQKAENVLKQLGIPMATAVDMYLRQISLTSSIPFQLSIPMAPRSIDASYMTQAEFNAALDAGYEDIQAGRVKTIDDLHAFIDNQSSEPTK